MLKRLLAWKYLICVAIIFGCAIYVSRQYESARKECEEECKQLNPLIATPSVHADKCNHCKETAEGNFPSWYGIFVWPGGIETLAILLTLLAVAEQSHQMRRAADAAFIQIRQVAMRERGWLSVEAGQIEVDDPAIMKWRVKTSIEIRNSGSGKAFVRRSGWNFVEVAEKDRVPPAKIPLAIPGNIVNGESTVRIPLRLDDLIEINTLAAAIESDAKVFRLYGFIEYEVAGLIFRKEFGYRWMPISSEFQGKVRYNLTDGLWLTDTKRDKPEREIKPN